MKLFTLAETFLIIFEQKLSKSSTKVPFSFTKPSAYRDLKALFPCVMGSWALCKETKSTTIWIKDSFSWGIALCWEKKKMRQMFSFRREQSSTQWSLGRELLAAKQIFFHFHKSFFNNFWINFCKSELNWAFLYWICVESLTKLHYFPLHIHKCALHIGVYRASIGSCNNFINFKKLSALS